MDNKEESKSVNDRLPKTGKEHYVCTGGCKGVSETPGVCQASGCTKHNQELIVCDCGDDLHNGFKN